VIVEGRSALGSIPLNVGMVFVNFCSSSAYKHKEAAR